MVVSFLALSLGTITFENPGIRLELFLKEVSMQTGQPYRCTAYLNNEVLAASFKDQSIDVLKTQLARVIHGTWTQKDDGWWLIQTADQKREEEKWVWDTRNMVLQTQIDALKAVAPTTEWTIKEAEKYWLDVKASRKKTGEAIWTAERRRALRLQSPESRLCARIASQLTVKMFVENPLQFNFNRYSNNGLPGHIALPIDFDAELRRYENERQLFQQIGETTENSKKAVHVELRYSSIEREYIFFSWLDKDWKYVGNSFPSVYLNAKTFLAQGESFPVSKETQDILDIQKETENYPLQPIFEKYKNSSIFADAVATMSNATKRDPLGIVQGRCWIDFAKYVKKPLLVSLKDDEMVEHPPRHVPVLNKTETTLGMMRDDANGWVLGRPINPLYNRTWRIDRKLIEEYAQFLNSVRGGNIYPILQIARINMVADMFTSGIPNPGFLLDDQQYRSYMICIFGGLSEQQLNDCLAGARLPVTALSQQGQQLVEVMARDGTFTDLSPLTDDESGDLCPLYYLPNGSKGMTIGTSFKIVPEFHFETEPVEDYGTDMDTDSLGALLKQAKPGDPIFDAKFTVSSNRVFVGTIYLGKKSKSDELSFPIDQKDLPTYTWKTLPDSIRQQVLEAMKKPVK